ncbi:MAG TPA: four helix bundle protein [Chloroflexia bacterium]|nr:four helix bundle protein [Chloroflexia bacterium]
MWDKAHQLTLAVYGATRAFPKNELFGVASQMRRASASIPANIAEGGGRSGAKELARFMDIVMGSASELEYHCLLARDLAFLDTSTHSQLETQIVEVKRMLGAYIQKIRNTS